MNPMDFFCIIFGIIAVISLKVNLIQFRKYEKLSTHIDVQCKLIGTKLDSKIFRKNSKKEEFHRGLLLAYMRIKMLMEYVNLTN